MKLYINTFLVVLLISFSSCNKDKLEPEFETGFESDVVFDTRTRIEGQLRGIYASVKNAGVYGGRHQIFNEIRGPEFNNVRSNVVTGFDIWNYSPTNNSVNSINNHWIRCYYVINLVNVFLDGMANKGGQEVVGTADATKWVAEARFVRAISYFSLLNFYARPYNDGNGSKPGVPLRLTPITGTGDYKLARATVAQVYDQILSDLNFAEANLGLTNGSVTSNTTRAHRNTAIAFKTRVYLNMGKYAEVITEANKIVSTSPPFTSATGVVHRLNPSFTEVFTNYTTAESIFSMPFFSNEAPGTQNQLAFYYNPGPLGGNGEYSLVASGIIANTGWRSVDARRTHIASTGSGSSVVRWLNKYQGRAPYTDWAPVLRYAEVLLNLAESLARVAGTGPVDSRSLELLNAVRNRSDAGVTLSATTNADLINQILLERRIELLGEGFAGLDITRLGNDLPSKTGVSSVPPALRNYIWPIPANELALNPLCVDN
jgi:starch-binding outer membrane protein, SusD/RagB family